jgi:ribosomal protein S26
LLMVKCVACGRKVPRDKALYFFGWYYCHECVDTIAKINKGDR